mmetsp:Transcript_141505/g.439875  ORF Transcript_141505/g.439875 Transcript_141505/m.439875 type:complete len:257 (+) Transcript_141505:1713-2483(+)
MYTVRHRSLDNRIETDELHLPVLAQQGLGALLAEVLIYGFENRLVDGVLLVCRVRCSPSPEQRVIARVTAPCPHFRWQDTHVRRGKGAGLVGAQHLHGCNLLQRSEVGHYRGSAGHLRSSDDHGHLHHQRQSDRHGPDDQGQHAEQSLRERDVAVERVDVEDDGRVDQGDADHRTHHLHDLCLEDAHAVARGLLHQPRCLPDLRAQARLLDLAVALALLDDATREQRPASACHLAITVWPRDLAGNWLSRQCSRIN